MVRITILFGVVLALIASIVSANPELLEGEWGCVTNQSDQIKFYGNQIGCCVTNGFAHYFQYLSAGTNSLSMNYGNGEIEVITYECSTNILDITAANSVTKSYSLINQNTNLCQKYLLQISGAQSIYRQDNPDAVTLPIAPIMQYLKVMPTCPNGGTYFIQSGQQPRCSSCSCNQQ